MDFNKRQQAFLYLGRDKFDFYGTGFVNVLTFPFSRAIILDLEIVNDAQLQTEIGQFIQQYNIPPENITIVLSPAVVFEKDIAGTSAPEEIKKFLDTVPFEDILSSTIPIENGVRVIASNKSMYDTLQAVFSKSGSITEAVIPYLAFGQDYALLDTLDAQTASTLLKRIDTVKRFNMIQPKSGEAQTQNAPEQKTQPEKKQARIRLYTMAGIFSLLLLILGLMLFRG